MFVINSAFANLPPPDPKMIEEQGEQVAEMGKAEVFSLSTYRLAQFVWDRYWKGAYQDNFTYYGTNPVELTPEQAKKPAILFLHALRSNHGEFLPMLHRFEEREIGPCFTLNYEDDFNDKIVQRIEAIREIYLKAGVAEVEIQLVGHSLGATNGVDFAYSPEKWPEGTKVTKVIAIAGRFKNIEHPEETPYYHYCHDVLVRLDDIWNRAESRIGGAVLYTVTAEEDWLIPRESIDLAEDGRRAVISKKGHLLVIFATETAKEVERFLKEPL